MADITDPEAVRFANEQIRVAANRLSQAYAFANVVIDNWNATGISSKLTNTADPVIDGSATDGRPPITGADCNNIINRLTELQTDYEASGSAKLNTILAVSVHNEV